MKKLIEKFRTKNSKNEIKEEDVILGQKVCDYGSTITDESVVLSFEDRFTHTLIVGPAGCGKTSQVIIPMVWRDIQIKNKAVGITVFDPDSYLAEKTYAMALHYNNQIDELIKNGEYDKNKHGEKKIIQYFNPVLKDCPYFNPLEGDEDDVIENIATAFSFVNKELPQYLRNLEDCVIRKSVKVVKRLCGDDATLLDLKTILCDIDKGKSNYILPLKELETMPNGESMSPCIKKENEEIANWFLLNYYPDTNKTYKNAQNLRTIIAKLVENKMLNRIFNPPRKGDINYENYLAFQNECADKKLLHKISFEEALEHGHIVAINTGHHTLRGLSKLLDYFFILQLESAIYKRLGSRKNHIPNMVYIKDFDNYTNWGCADILKICQNCNIAFHISIHDLKLLGANLEKNPKDFIDIMLYHIKNHIIYPGIRFDDAKYYSERDLDEKFKNQKCKRRCLSRKKIIYGKSIDYERPSYITPTDIMDLPFGMFTYQTKIKNKTQTCIVKANYIPKELNDLLEKIMGYERTKRC